MRPFRVVMAVVLALATGCTTASHSPVPTVWRCGTSAAQGSCGPFDRYPGITGTTSSTRIGNNVWSPVSGWRQTLHANNPGQWMVTATMPDRNSAIVSYPSIGANYGRITNVPTPLSSFSLIRSRFVEDMNATARTSAWATYDIWLGRNGCSDCASHEVMIQHDFAGNGACASVDRANFPGTDGTLQPWHLCKYGSELIWKLGISEYQKVSEQSGVVHILPMLRWLVQHGYLPGDTGLWQIGYGWEIASTGGTPEMFQVSAFALQVSCTTRECR